ncbi:hypothetical protein K1T71_002232 [Dendrolimus kikuchii]|uniref:Uncharacterized protein n=1 Tax=Dendrolimus kikuchii TaxID=765133 RepID=A0ACC1DGS7_9NEOP|nr:hypothetical protein K1T71_002232 [Dendrolimus kikuchii]
MKFFLSVQERRKITISCVGAACRKRRQNNPQPDARAFARLDGYRPWSKVCRHNNLELYARRSGRPVTDEIDTIFQKVEQDRHISSYDVAGEMGIDHKTVLAHFKKSGYTKKLDIWVPHELTERNIMNRVLICDSLLRRKETEPFLKKLITGDEKWITYDNSVRKRSWSKADQASQTVVKPGLTRNKVMLCIWWD